MRRASPALSGGVLLVNHGYPPYYNGGSEIDTQTTAHGLRRSGDARWSRVAVFAREANVFAPDFVLRTTVDADDATVPLHLVNNAREAPYTRFENAGIDAAFREVMAARRPRVVHFGHVNHLSVNLPRIARREFGAAVVFTLHDFFLQCPRGNFLRVGPAPAGTPVYELCTKQVDAVCAARCFAARFATGAEGAAADEESAYWTRWVTQRMGAFRAMKDYVDAFTVPSQTLLARFAADAGVAPARLRYLAYGFDHERLSGRARARPAPGGPLVLAYIGRHVPAKGIDLLVTAAHRVVQRDPAASARLRVRIYGWTDGASTASLHRLTDACVEASVAAGVPRTAAVDLIHFCAPYRNADIVRTVFDAVDGIVVPSIWDENAPLVIHEAQQARVPVITADAGGMRELVADGVNGYLHKHRSADALADAIERALASPVEFADLGARGYLHSSSGDVPHIDEQIGKLRRIYSDVAG